MLNRVKFGTSGVRGLVSDLTDKVCVSFMRAFIKHCESNFSDKLKSNKKIIFAGDFRESSPRIKAVIMNLAANLGFQVYDGGLAPTPALAYSCQKQNALGIMITGSHIPADRNGFKFYFPWGEILKSDELQISKYYELFENSIEEKNIESSHFQPNSLNILTPFNERYSSVFGENILRGVKVVFYQHSTLAQLSIPEVLRQLGAEVIIALPSKEFVAVDTEAFDANPALLEIIKNEKPFATISADGDGDRPIVINEKSEMIPGDILGILCCKFLNADQVVTPVTSNSSLENCGFRKVVRTKVGSPFVIEAMDSGVTETCCGFEANGGFLLGSDVIINGRVLEKLPTRDSVLPAVIPLIMAKQKNMTLSQLVEDLAPLATYSDLIRSFDVSKSQVVLKKAIDNFTVDSRKPIKVDFTDGVRFYFDDKSIVHLRPSGNAPEFRIYTESKNKSRACELASIARKFIVENSVMENSNV